MHSSCQRFGPAQPQVWFLQAKAQFQLHNITSDSTQFYHVCCCPRPGYCWARGGLLSNPPEQGHYKALNCHFGLSRRECASWVLRMHGLGDCRPSQLMDEMLALLDGHTPCLLFEQIFWSSFQKMFRSCLLMLISLICALGWLVIKTFEATTTTTVSHVSVVPKRRNKFSSTSTEFTDTKGLCFYHSRFGNKAHKCEAPCTFPGNALANRR